MAPAPDAGDPPGLRQQAMQLFETFVRLLDEAPAERQHTAFVMQLRELDLLKVGNVGLTLQASVRKPLSWLEGQNSAMSLGACTQLYWTPRVHA